MSKPYSMRVEIHLSAELTEVFASVLRECNANSTEPMSPSELASSMIAGILLDDVQFSDRVLN